MTFPLLWCDNSLFFWAKKCSYCKVWQWQNERTDDGVWIMIMIMTTVKLFSCQWVVHQAQADTVHGLLHYFQRLTNIQLCLSRASYSNRWQHIIINLTLSLSINNRQFQLLLQELNLQYCAAWKDKNVTRWLCCGHVCYCCAECFLEIKTFYGSQKSKPTLTYMIRSGWEP